MPVPVMAPCFCDDPWAMGSAAQGKLLKTRPRRLHPFRHAVELMCHLRVQCDRKVIAAVRNSPLAFPAPDARYQTLPMWNSVAHE